MTPCGLMFVHHLATWQQKEETPHVLLGSGSSEELTGQGERREVDGDVVLIAVKLAVLALQVVPVTGVLGHPLHLVTTVGFRRHFRSAALLRRRNKDHLQRRRRNNTD